MCVCVTFSESVITLKASIKRTNRKVKGQESMSHSSVLKDLGKLIAGEEKIKSGQVCCLHITEEGECT